MSRKNKEVLELIRRKVSMSQKIVTNVDPEYAWYVGADPELATKMATVDFILKAGFLPKEYIPFVKLYRMYLDQQRKAVFSNLCTELTKLGFLLGDQTRVIKSKRSRNNI